MGAPVTVQEVSAEDLRFGYRHQIAVDGVRFEFHPGEFVAVVGPNGCGKSTLLRLLIGALTPDAGQVRIDGRAVRQWGRVGMARRMALVPQMIGNDGGGGLGAGMPGGAMTVGQMVLMARYAAHVEDSRWLRAAGGLGIFGFETPGDEQAATTAMWNADVHHLVDRDMGALSGGERQRVAIARALAQDTPVILLDEPTSALDLYHELELLEQLRRLAGDGRLVVLVTHDLNLAMEHATRVLMMQQGRIVADGPPERTLTPQEVEKVYQVKVRTEGGLLRFARRESLGADTRRP